MLASDGIRFVLMLALAGVAAAGLPVALAPIVAALSTAAASVYIPCVAATTPRLVDDADLPAANAARSAIQRVCIVAGPGLGGAPRTRGRGAGAGAPRSRVRGRGRLGRPPPGGVRWWPGTPRGPRGIGR